MDEPSTSVVELLDEDGEPILASSASVEFSTDRCVFDDEDGLGLDEFKDAADAFADYNDDPEPDTAQVVFDWLEEYDASDADDDSNDVASFTLDKRTMDFSKGDTLVAIILDCSDSDNEPGIATIDFVISVSGNDIEGSVEVTVVGPPKSITVEASPSSGLLCGEKSTIVANVWDAAGQPVSDHTRVEAVTNFGGVLGGTGAVAAQQGLVSPVSSTIAETFGGTSTIFLLTSSSHEGPYEVVIASGGGGSVASGGSFSTPPAVSQVTVTCEGPAPPPVVTAPDTGVGGITPPSTGDAGLAERSGASATLFAVIGVVAFMAAGLATLKFARR